MSYKEIEGNIFNSRSEALINTVNCFGVMGKGIALEFKRRFPEMYKKYVVECDKGNYHPGEIHFYNERNKTIINFAIKDHWRNPSKIDWVTSCLEKFSDEYRQKEIKSAAFPLLGTVNGKLPVDKVKEVMLNYLEHLKDISIEVYDFDPEANDHLFSLLVELVSKNKKEEFQKISRIRNDSIAKLFKAVKEGKANNFYSLSKYKIVGEKTIDKIYAALIYLESNPNSQVQLSLPGDWVG